MEQSPNYIVEPINTIEEGIHKGFYTGYNQNIVPRIKLPKINIPKSICIIAFLESILVTDLEFRLRSLGLKPCKNAPNYLLGLMAQVPETSMSPTLFNLDIVAVEFQTYSIFSYYDLPSFLCISRGIAHRSPGLLTVNSSFLSKRRAFLVEKI